MIGSLNFLGGVKKDENEDDDRLIDIYWRRKKDETVDDDSLTEFHRRCKKDENLDDDRAH
jgi:hypothetical protein